MPSRDKAAVRILKKDRRKRVRLGAIVYIARTLARKRFSKTIECLDDAEKRWASYNFRIESSGFCRNLGIEEALRTTRCRWFDAIDPYSFGQVQ